MQLDKSRKFNGLDEYFTLGRTGLRVSPLCLGTMTFGTDWGWGTEARTAQDMFVRYVEQGGNFIDTADGYTNGSSEEILGNIIRETNSRDQVVLATKFTFSGEPGNANASGNGRKNIYRALEGSLRRLKTDYIDLYWLHAWDLVTPVEEVLYTLNDLVRSGKVRHIGFSDTPAWYFTKAQTISEMRGLETIAALQLEYSLVERNIEREHIPAAREMGIGVCSWSPLASGFLAGKYKKTNKGIEGSGRLMTVKDSENPIFKKFNKRNWNILDALQGVAKKLGRPSSQVALNWATKRPGITSTIIGATTMEQLENNLHCLDFDIPEELNRELEMIGRPEQVFPYHYFNPEMQSFLNGEVKIRTEPPWYHQ